MGDNNSVDQMFAGDAVTADFGDVLVAGVATRDNNAGGRLVLGRYVLAEAKAIVSCDHRGTLRPAGMAGVHRRMQYRQARRRHGLAG